MTQVRRTQLGRSTRARDLRRELDLDASAFGHAGHPSWRRGAGERGSAQRSRPTATQSISTAAPFGSPEAAIVVRAGGAAPNAWP